MEPWKFCLDQNTHWDQRPSLVSIGKTLFPQTGSTTSLSSSVGWGSGVHSFPPPHPMSQSVFYCYEETS